MTLYAEQMYLYEVSPIIGITENGSAANLERSMAFGLQLQYNDIDFFIKPEVTYIFSPNIGVYDKATNSVSDATVNGNLLMFNGVYDLEYTALLTPFLKAGIGYQSVSDMPEINTDAFVIGTGAGLKLHVYDKIAVKFEVVYTLQDFGCSNILAFGGLNFSFGNEDNRPASEYIEDTVETPTEHNTTINANVTIAPALIVAQEPVYISKEDFNLSVEEPERQEVVLRDTHKQLKSLTLFVPYLFRSFQLDDESKTILIHYAKELKNQQSSITIIGHTDAKGRRAFNKELSLKRAEVVKALFVEYGVDAKRITVEGRGESDPIADPNNPAANHLNKRIEIKIENNTITHTPQ